MKNTYREISIKPNQLVKMEAKCTKKGRMKTYIHLLGKKNHVNRENNQVLNFLRHGFSPINDVIQSSTKIIFLLKYTVSRS